MQAAGNEGVAGLIKRSDGSIGYVEHGFARRLSLPVAVLENRAGQYVPPNEESGQAGLAASVIDPEQLQQAVVDPSAPSAYPIVSYSWLFLYKTYGDAQLASALKSFVQWALTSGQERARAMGYVPLSAEAAALGQAALGTQSQ
jgi:phosphate transport system substrate-binding protein